MWIKNIKTGVLQECHNKDVIRICQKDADHYKVTEEKPESIETGAAGGSDGGSAEPEQLEEMTVAELKNLAKEKGLEGYSSLARAELLELLKGVV